MKPNDTGHSHLNETPIIRSIFNSKANSWALRTVHTLRIGPVENRQRKDWSVRGLSRRTSFNVAFADDMANPQSANPLERESTQVTCVASAEGQPSLTNEYWTEHLARFDLGGQVNRTKQKLTPTHCCESKLAWISEKN